MDGKTAAGLVALLMICVTAIAVTFLLTAPTGCSL